MKTATGKYTNSKDGVKTYYDVLDSNKDLCVIFLHGLGGNLSAWDKEREFFYKKGISSIAMDLRGHGFSDRPLELEQYSLDKFATDVIGIIENESFSDYVVVGHCFGGMVSMYLAAEYPKSSRGLALVDTSFKPPKFLEPIKNNPFLKNILKLLANNLPNNHLSKHMDFDGFIGGEDIDLLRILEDILYTSLRSYLMICETLIGYDATKLLNKIVMPTLVVDGTEDSVFPPDVARNLESRIKGASIDMIPGANHILVINNPKDLSIEIDKFLIKQKFV